MALIKCPECGKEISDKAKSCIYCGYPISKIDMSAEMKKNNGSEKQGNIAEYPQKHTDISRMQVETTTSSAQQGNKPQKKYIIIVITAVLAILAIVAIKSASDNAAARERDLSSVFDFSFDMTKEDIIAYELEKYGNEEYEFDAENNRFDFEAYGYDDWKHRYFFDDETDLLTSVHYSGVIISFGDKDEAECEHVVPIKRALLDVIGEWDEKPSGDSVRSVAYGLIDGISCKILYFDGATQEISIRRIEE